MKTKKKVENTDKTAWEELLKLAKKDDFSMIIDENILIRRIPHNYEVVYKKEVSTPCYYGSFKNAVEKRN